MAGMLTRLSQCSCTHYRQLENTHIKHLLQRQWPIKYTANAFGKRTQQLTARSIQISTRSCASSDNGKNSLPNLSATITSNASENDHEINVAPQQSSDKNVPLLSIVVLAFAVLGGFSYFLLIDSQRQENIYKAQPVRPHGAIDLPGKFDLKDIQSGKRVSDRDLLGRFALVYFGFTHCPDICPTELIKVEKALRLLRQRLDIEAVKDPRFSDAFPTPFFISVDPRRDTPDRVQTFAKQYSTNFRWLTGTPEELRRAASNFRAYIEVNGNISEEGTVPDDYLVDHSIYWYLKGPSGPVLDFYGQRVTAEEMCDRAFVTIYETVNGKT